MTVTLQKIKDVYIPRLRRRWPQGEMPIRLDSPAVLGAVGLFLLAVYCAIALYLLPLPDIYSDNEHFRHWVDSNFKYSSSPFDFGVMSPYEGLGGLDQPLGVWVNASFIIPHVLPFTDSRTGTYFVNFVLLSLATWILARAMGVHPVPSVVGTQVFVFLFCIPGEACANWMTHFSGAAFDQAVPHLITPTALVTVCGAVFSYIGRSSRAGNIVLTLLIPALVIYAVLCDPLYAANSLVFLCFLLAGIFLDRERREIFLWRTAAIVFAALVFLAIRLPTFYEALAGYCARARFPNELYVEVQQWDALTGLIFQGGLATPCCLLVIIGALFMIIQGTRRVRWFAAAILAFQVFIAVLSFIYVYSGIRWAWPAPLYMETAAYPAYLAVILLGIPMAARSAVRLFQARLLGGRRVLARSLRRRRLVSAYRAVSAVPICGIVFVLLSRDCNLPYMSYGKDTRLYPLTGIAGYLHDQLAIGNSGLFRGAVASLVGVPGGGMMRQMKIPDDAPYEKWNIALVELYFRPYDPHLSMCGLWDIGVPTLEDNNHLVTPPFYFLISRALSRSQDFHSRNWTTITRVRPALMAALGARFLFTDCLQQDARLAMRAGQTNPADGLKLYLYEITNPNVGNFSPLRTISSTDAKQTIGMLISDGFPFQDTAVVDGPSISGLTRASEGAIYYERGGVRVVAQTTGTSLLILPLQFSNSLKVISTEENSSGHPIQLLRANLVETGLLFQGRINLKIAHVFGLFRALDGRLRDIDDCGRLGIVEDGTIPYPPDYQPLAHKESGVFRDLFFPKVEH